jgi:Family of unknown function (DUF6624)
MRQTFLILALLFIAVSGVSAEKHWIPADPAKTCASVKDKVLCAELLSIRDRDQNARYDALNHPEDKSLQAVIERVDRENLARVEEIIQTYGWPAKSLVGEKAGGGAWTVVQHADLAVQKKYLTVMSKAADAGELAWALLATTIDRIQVSEGKPQTYGSQFHEVNGEWVPQPIEDDAHVDERRSKVGLQPLAEYAALLKEMHARPSKPPK